LRTVHVYARYAKIKAASGGGKRVLAAIGIVTMNVEKLTKAITGFADYFIPAELKAERDQLNQARVFLISHIFGPFIGSTVPLALFILDPTPGFDVAVLALSILCFWVFPPLLRWTGSYRLLALLSVENLVFCILWSCYFYGGVTSPTLPWVLIIPLLAFFYIGHSIFMRMMVIGLFVLNVGVFLALYLNFPPPANDINVKQIENLGIVSMIATSLYVAMMALYFAKVYESQSELEALVREHIATAAELREATAQAERAGAAKAEFLAKTSHELRTPLNAIIGYSEILREQAQDENDPETTQDLDRIHDAGVHLLRLINEILDLAKIDAGKMEVFEEPCVVEQTINCVVDACKNAAVAQRDKISVSVAANVGERLLDEHKFRQVVLQVVENAVKFTKDGTITIDAHVVSTVSGDRLIVSVRDTGCGIAPGNLATLFEQFSVLGDTSGTKYGGTGLGLALSRKLCRLLGGDITAASELGHGSTFTIEIPARLAVAEIKPVMGAGQSAQRSRPSDLAAA
jgi:signal transduction histidine kinase